MANHSLPQPPSDPFDDDLTIWKPPARKPEPGPYTTLPDRAALADLAGHEAEVAARTGNSIAVILFDLDSFDVVNLCHGYDFGDRVLHEVETIVRLAVQDSGLFARLEEDEFMIVLPNASRRNAVELAESIRARLAKIGGGIANLQVSACFGVASLVPDADGLGWIQSMAKGALERAKQKGSNCIETSSVVAFRSSVAA
jgi:diguanylate cyclase (GGDEF)-like protein